MLLLGIVPDSFLQGFTHKRVSERFRQALATGSEETYLTERDGTVLGFVTLGACRDSDVDSARVAAALTMLSDE